MVRVEYCFSVKVRATATDEINLMFVPTVSESDIQQVKTALAINNINIPNWVKSMSVKDLDTLFDLLESDKKRAGQITSIIAPFMPFICEYSELEAGHF